MCKCTPEIRTPFCGRGDCLPPASREPTESLFAVNAEQAALNWALNYAAKHQPRGSDSDADIAHLIVEQTKRIAELTIENGHLHIQLRQAEDRETALRDALVRAKDALNWRDNKIRLRHRDPLGEAEIRALGERVGYGVLMSTASRLWYEKAGGGAFAVGDCLSTVEAADEAAARALSGEGSNQND